MKKYLNELNQEELTKIIENNESIKTLIFNTCYEDNMYWQEERAKDFFGNNWSKYINYHYSYNTFYLTIKNAIEFFENLSNNNYQYLKIEDSNVYIKLYNEAKKYYNNIKKCNYQSDKYFENEEKLENICEDILQILEKELHSFENISTEDVQEQFFLDVTENNCYNDFYIIDNNLNIVYQDITKKYI